MDFLSSGFSSISCVSKRGVMDFVSAYIPADRRRAMASGQTLPDRTQGAALFADISGFTQLTEALMRELGPHRGAEELAYHLNQVYDATISEARRFGGVVIGFSGDAITCWFGSDSGLRATAAGLAMMEAMEHFTSLTSPSGVQISLAMKAGVATGPARRFMVGDPDVQLFDVLAGALVDELAAAEQAAEQGEVILAPSTIASLGEFARISEWRLGPSAESGRSFGVVRELVLPEAPFAEEVFPPDLLEEHTLRSWMPRPVYARLREGQGEFLAELRSVVVLFLRFGGIDYDEDERAGDKLEAFVRWVQNSFARYDGSLLQLTMGDKGSYLYGAFGAPIAHEDDPVRAAMVALELRELPPELDFIHAPEIGISQGRMRVGAYGSPTRSTYGVQGNEANIAARLMAKAAPGQILVSARIAERVAPLCQLEELGRISLKGQPRPLPIHALVGLRKRFTRKTRGGREAGPIVGRELERRLLRDALQALLAKKKSTILIEGEAGIGKSQLVARFIAMARQANVPVLLGAGDPIGRRTVYHAWRPVFQDLFELPETIGTRALQDQVIARLPQTGQFLERAPLLNAVLPINLPENELTAQMTGELRASNTVDLMSGLLAQRSGYVLILEDAHWLDSASWALLEQVNSRVGANMLLVVTRPMAEEEMGGDLQGGMLIPDEYKRLAKDPETQRIQLTTLGPEDVAKLIRLRLGVERLPEPLVDLILKRAEGHPFFSEEIAYSLRDAGIMRIESGKVRLAMDLEELQELDFPETIQGVITTRLDQLSASELLTLKVASVIGRVFQFRTLCEVHPVPEAKDHLGADLANLERLDITPMERPEPDMAYMFKHAITQEVTYNLMLFAQKGRLHRAVGEWLEDNYSEDLVPFYSLLAYHWGKVAEIQPEARLPTQKAIEFLDKSGQEAIRNYANREAVRFLHEAVALSERGFVEIDSHQRARWERRIGEAYLALGDLAHSQEHLDRSVALLGHPAHASTLRSGLRLMGELVRQVLHRIWPSRFVGWRLEAAESHAELARAYERLGFVYYFSGDSMRLLTAGLQILNLSESAGLASRELAGGYATNSYTAGLLGFRRLAENYHRRGVRLAEEIEDLPSLGWVHVVWGNYSLGIADWDRAEDAFRQVDQIARHLGDLRRLEECMTLWGMAHYYQGRLDSAQSKSAEVISLSRMSGDTQGTIWALFGNAGVLITRGDFSEAIDALRQGLELLEGIPDRLEEVRGYGLLARAYLYQGQEELAYEAARLSSDLISGLPIPTGYYLLEGYAGAAEVYLKLCEREFTPDDRKDSISRLAARACRALRRFARFFPIGRPYAALWQGHLDWQNGREGAAVKLWARGLKHAQDLQMPYPAGLIHAALGRGLHPTDPSRKVHIERAVNVFTELEANHHLAALHSVAGST